MGDQAEGDGNKFWLSPEGAPALRLDRFVRQCLPHLSRQEIHRAIAENIFRLNGRIARKGDRVNAGDRLSFVGPLELLADAPPPAPQLAIPIIYEDESDDEDLPSDEAGRRKIKKNYEELLGIRIDKLRGRVLNREKINKSIDGLYFICFECRKICHNLDDGWVEETVTLNNFCGPCAKAKGIKASAA